jgi:hypothetical protein
MRTKIKGIGKLILILFFLLFEFINLYAQLPDATFATPGYAFELVKNLPQENSLKFDTSSIDLSVKLSIAIYIVRDNNGNLNVDTTLISSIISNLNNYFKPIGVSFKVTSVAKVDDYNYSYFSLYNIPKELLTKHSVINTINLYLVDSISKDSISYYGFTYFPNDTLHNYIFLQKNFFESNYVACMLGHFFGLLSTHEKVLGLEYVNEINCSTKGDLICDTYADPDIFGLVSDTCLYIGQLKDPNNKYYVPSVVNLMSNSPGHCRCLFTFQQYKRMYFYYKKFRQYLR